MKIDKKYQDMLSTVAIDGSFTLYKFVPTLFKPLLLEFEPISRTRRVRLLLEYLHREHYSVYYLSYLGELVGYCIAVQGGRRLRCSSKRDIVLGPD